MLGGEQALKKKVPLVLRNLRPWGGQGLRDLAVIDGYFAAVTESTVAESTIDAEGRLAIPGFIEPHIHLDKVLINNSVRPNRSGTLTEAIEIIWERKRSYTVEEIADRAGEVIESAIANGVTHLRTHVDVDTIGGLRPLKGVALARDCYKNFIDIQIVAFPQEGILRNRGCEELMWQAIEAGADLVGGMPLNENSFDDSVRHIEIAFEIARKFNADIDMHVDETDDPSARTLEILAEQTIKNGWQGRVTAGHTCALAAYPDDYAEIVMDKVARRHSHDLQSCNESDAPGTIGQSAGAAWNHACARANRPRRQCKLWARLRLRYLLSVRQG
jgi:cytosine deaminase